MWVTRLTQKIEAWAARNSAVYKLAEGYYRDVVQKEVALANINEGDHILCIGGGFCPFSAILLHRETGARVTVIDNCNDCVLLAQQMIRRMGLEKFIHVRLQDGASTPIGDYTVVHFALQVFPMECVFNHVKSQAAPGTRFLIRRPKDGLRSLYSKISNKVKHMLNQCPFAVHNNARNIGKTLLYVKVA
ncbi:MAG: hypothetical protein FWC16_06925 [Defluviitaleaceae bacterium]|nr:hypothetical protein [Defluviitaleaceae bacterium]MCL2274644.1 hypothetical protein [Defluviitaleaceae bacterium]